MTQACTFDLGSDRLLEQATFWVIAVGIGGVGTGILAILGIACLATFRSVESCSSNQSRRAGGDRQRYLQLHVLFILTVNIFLQARNMYTLIGALLFVDSSHLSSFSHGDWSDILIVLTMALNDGLLVGILLFPQT